MDERIKESISALMDDEVNELELQRILSHADRDELSEIWQQYHAIRDALNGDVVGEALSIDVSQSVSDWIENDSDDSVVEPVAQADNASAASFAPKAGGIIAVAASIVFAVAFVVQNTATYQASEVPALAEAQVDEAAPYAVASQSARQPKIIRHIDKEHARRLNQYLLRHAEHSMLGARQGTMPFVRVASVNSVGI